MVLQVELGQLDLFFVCDVKYVYSLIHKVSSVPRD